MSVTPDDDPCERCDRPKPEGSVLCPQCEDQRQADQRLSIHDRPPRKVR